LSLVGGEQRTVVAETQLEERHTEVSVDPPLLPTLAVKDRSVAWKFMPFIVSDAPLVVGAFGGLLSAVSTGASKLKTSVKVPVMPSLVKMTVFLLPVARIAVFAAVPS